MFVRSAYNYDRDAASDESGLFCPEESKAIQSAKDECDINVIVKNYAVTGQVPQIPMPPLHGDFEGVTDFHVAMEMIRASEVSFMKLPAQVRNKFDNNPGAFVDFASDPANIDTLRDWGLAVSKENRDGVDGKVGSSPAGSVGASAGGVGG